MFYLDFRLQKRDFTTSKISLPLLLESLISFALLHYECTSLHYIAIINTIDPVIWITHAIHLVCGPELIKCTAKATPNAIVSIKITTASKHVTIQLRIPLQSAVQFIGIGLGQGLLREYSSTLQIVENGFSNTTTQKAQSSPHQFSCHLIVEGRI